MSKGGVTSKDNVFTKAAEAYNQAGVGTLGAYDQYASLGGYKPALAGQASGYKPNTMAAPGTIAGGIDRYMNPYTSKVVDSTVSTMDRARQLALMQNGDAAVAAGAFGGSRHGVVEAETNSGYNRNVGEVTGNLLERGFNTAAGLSAQDIANSMSVNAGNAGILNTAGQFAANANNQFALADQIAKNQASQFAGQQQAVGAGGMLAAGQQAGALAGQGLAMGQSINNQNNQMGTQQQQATQAVIDAIKQQFGGFTGQNANILQMLTSVLSGSPLNQQTTTTQGYKPGILDYLSVLGNAAATAYNPTK